jgi:acetoin utilization deacetylase AcuC-like enzyme
MHAYYCHHFVLPLPEGHRFPMAKYARLHERLQARAAGLGLELAVPEPAGIDDLLRVHDPGYVTRMLEGTMADAELRRIGFPWSVQMVERSRRSSGATIAALRRALAGDGVAVNLAGGTHHAGPARGGGYCVFNDAAVAARHVQAQGLARRLLVIDLDVHHGDGTAAIFRDDPSVYTMSVHAARNYPAVKPAGDLDVALPDGTGDAAYLDAVAPALARAIGEARAQAAIYLAGADPYADDRLGLLALSKPGLRARDELVLQACRRAGLPVAVAMAGGYANEVEDIVDIHEATVLAALAAFRAWRGPSSGTGPDERVGAGAART